MVVSEVLINMRNRLTDSDKIEYGDAELINYINDAIALIWMQLVSVFSPDVIKKVKIESTNQSKPSDFYRFTTKYPIITIGDTFEVYGNIPFEANYFIKSPIVLNASDNKNIFNELYNSAIIQIACLYALNTNEFDIQQDSALAVEARKLIGVGGV